MRGFYAANGMSGLFPWPATHVRFQKRRGGKAPVVAIDETKLAEARYFVIHSSIKGIIAVVNGDYAG
jgi:hypothetical protein